jgi:hypothetical protein
MAVSVARHQPLAQQFRAMHPMPERVCLNAASAVVGFHGWAFQRGGPTAAAPRSAIALWHHRVSYARSAITLPISCSHWI